MLVRRRELASVLKNLSVVPLKIWVLKECLTRPRTTCEAGRRRSMSTHFTYAGRPAKAGMHWHDDASLSALTSLSLLLGEQARCKGSGEVVTKSGDLTVPVGRHLALARARNSRYFRTGTYRAIAYCSLLQLTQQAYTRCAWYDNKCRTESYRIAAVPGRGFHPGHTPSRLEITMLPITLAADAPGIYNLLHLN